MKKQEILEKIYSLSNQIEKLRKKLNRLDNATSKRFRNRFVIDISKKKGFYEPKITPEGQKELAKYGKQEGVVDTEFFWDNPGVSYTPDKCFCMICGNTHVVSYISYGVCPRFAACSKHNDFLDLGDRIIVKGEK